MGPKGGNARGVFVLAGLALVSGIAGLMIMARPGETPQGAQPAARETAARETAARDSAAPESAARESAAPASALPEPAGGTAGEIVWIPRYDFALEVDGKPSPDACFYQESQSRRILINAPDLSKVCILNQEGKQVTAIDRGKVKFDSGSDQARLLPGADGGPASPYTIDQSSVVFYVGSNRLKIMAKQPLIGPATPDNIVRHSPLYRKGIQEYVPAPADLAYLKGYQTPIEIEVFFGTWCPHCKVLVPKFMKTMEQAANQKLAVSYHGVPTGFDKYEPARSNGVVGIPTFIFWKDGKEVARIPGDPGNDTIEHAVAEILRRLKS